MPSASRSRGRKRPTRSRSKAAPEPIAAGDGQRLWMLDIPYGVRPSDATYDRARKAWVHAGPTLPDSLRPFASTPYSRLRWLQDEANDVVSPGPQHIAAKSPRPLQLEGASLITEAARAGARGFLLTDDVGNGKTITAWLAAREIAERRAFGDGSVLILVDRPSSITIPHWRSTIAAVGDDDSVNLKWPQGGGAHSGERRNT